MLRRALAVALGSAALACGPAPGTWSGEGEVEDRALTLTAELDAPPRAKVLLLGFLDSQVEDGRPDKSARPAYYWTSDELAVTADLAITAPLPPKLHLIAVLDADGDGRPGPDELSSGILMDFEPAVTPTIQLQERFSDLAAQRRGAVPGTLEIDLSGVTPPVTAERVVVVVLGYDDRAMKDGLPKGGALPGHLWTSKPMAPAPTLRVDASMPRPGLTPFVAIDEDGDALLSPEEPLSAALVRPASGPWSVPITARFAPKEDPPPTPTPPPLPDAPPEAATDAPTQPAKDPTEFVAARLTIRSDRPARAAVARFVVVGYPAADVTDRTLPQTPPTWSWTRLERPGPWPAVIEGRVPKHTPWFVVLDLDESGGPSAGDPVSLVQQPGGDRDGVAREVPLEAVVPAGEPAP